MSGSEREHDTGVRVVLSTVPSEAVGETLARALLDEQLAACVNIVPGVRSLYRFRGKLEDDHELLLVIKTTRDRYARLEERIRALHPYEVCEVVAVDVAAGAAPYLAWVLGETRA